MNKIRIMILKELKNEIVSAYDLSRKTRKKNELVKELNHLYSKELIIPVYQDNQLYFVSR